MTPWWLSVLVALISFGGAWLVYRNRRVENKTNSEKFISEAAVSLLKPYQEEVSKLRDEVAALKCEVEKLTQTVERTVEEIDRVTAGAHLLHHQVVSMGGQPLYSPPERRDHAP